MHPDAVGWRESRQIMESLKYSIKIRKYYPSTIEVVDILKIQMYKSNIMDPGPWPLR